MITIEKIEIDGEVRETEVDWSLYYGANTNYSKYGYIRFIEKLKEVNGILLSKYTNAKTIVKYKIDEVTMKKTPDEISRQIKTIHKTKALCEENGDKLIGLSGLDANGAIVALIETKGFKIEKSINALTKYYKAREQAYDVFNKFSIEVITPYVSAKDIMKIQVDDVEISMSYDKFKSNTLKSLNRFFTLIEKIKHHKFIKFSHYSSNDNGLVATILSSYGETPQEVEVSIGSYGSFVKSEKEIINICKKNNYNMITQYLGNDNPIEIDFRCEHGTHITKPTLLKKGCICPACASENYRGENTATWKGGITPLHNYLREKINKWKVDSFNQTNYKCVITGVSGNNIVHHITGFNTILFETMETLNLPIHQTINEYTLEELKLIEDRCLELHYKYGLGVVLCPEVHNEFHSIYGYGDNTPEQFEEFKKNKLRELKEVV